MTIIPANPEHLGARIRITAVLHTSGSAPVDAFLAGGGAGSPRPDRRCVSPTIRALRDDGRARRSPRQQTGPRGSLESQNLN
ncbi:hypothetical protein Bdiaspc4_10615 [Bradyrhizobium diazoefficiens]|nr:hypothetical protein CO678_39365 [Bradyrhizobium diazoefficiens]QBP20917.1 hypothetical protein Bdiaspc4_10615 [Bradyrhizobium diazoefficiens]